MAARLPPGTQPSASSVSRSRDDASHSAPRASAGALTSRPRRGRPAARARLHAVRGVPQGTHDGRRPDSPRRVAHRPAQRIVDVARSGAFASTRCLRLHERPPMVASTARAASPSAGGDAASAATPLAHRGSGSRDALSSIPCARTPPELRRTRAHGHSHPRDRVRQAPARRGRRWPALPADRARGTHASAGLPRGLRERRSLSPRPPTRALGSYLTRTARIRVAQRARRPAAPTSALGEGSAALLVSRRVAVARWRPRSARALGTASTASDGAPARTVVGSVVASSRRPCTSSFARLAGASRLSRTAGRGAAPLTQLRGSSHVMASARPGIRRRTPVGAPVLVPALQTAPTIRARRRASSPPSSSSRRRVELCRDELRTVTSGGSPPRIRRSAQRDRTSSIGCGNAISYPRRASAILAGA